MPPELINVLQASIDLIRTELQMKRTSPLFEANLQRYVNASLLFLSGKPFPCAQKERNWICSNVSGKQKRMWRMRLLKSSREMRNIPLPHLILDVQEGAILHKKFICKVQEGKMANVCVTETSVFPKRNQGLAPGENGNGTGVLLVCRYECV